MTSEPSDRARHDRFWLQGWAISLTLHGVAVTLASLFVTSLSMPPQHETFRWEVAVVGPADSTPTVGPASSAVAAPVPPQSVIQQPVARPPVPLPAPALPRESSRPTGSEAPPPSQTKPASPLVQQTQPLTRPSEPVRSRVELPVPPVSSPPKPAPQPSQPPTVETTASPPEVEPPGETAVKSSAETAPPSVEPVVFPQPEPAHDVVESPQARQPEPAPPTIEPEALRADATQPSPAVAPVPGPFSPSALAESGVQSQSVVDQSQIARAPTPQSSLGTERPMPSPGKPDYSWLAQDLMSRIEHMIRYPAEARINQWQGKVVVRVVILADGEIESVKIVQSSGHPVLDEDALALLRRISPLKLNQPLGKERIPLHVPIRYSLK